MKIREILEEVFLTKDEMFNDEHIRPRIAQAEQEIRGMIEGMRKKETIMAERVREAKQRIETILAQPPDRISSIAIDEYAKIREDILAISAWMLGEH